VNIEHSQWSRRVSSSPVSSVDRLFHLTNCIRRWLEWTNHSWT